MRELLKKHKIDIIVLAALLLIAAIAVGVTLGSRKSGTRVRVTVDGTVVGEYRLDTDGKYSINGGSNILVIEGGCAFLEYADCPAGTCVKTGRIKYVNQSIICLPNRVTVTVIGEAGGGVDLVS